MGISGGPYVIRDSSLVLEIDAADRNSYVSGSTTWFDLTSNNNSGSLLNGVTASAANQGILGFDGVNDYVLCPPSSSTTAISGPLTVSFWINPTVLPTSNNIASLAATYKPNEGGYDFRIYNKSGVMSIGLVTNAIPDSEGGGDVAYTFLTNTWYMVSGTYDSSYSNLYINGVYLNRVANTKNPGAGKKGLHIGKLGEWTTPSDIGRYFNGRIANVLLYNRALSAQEILQNYNAQKSRFGLT